MCKRTEIILTKVLSRKLFILIVLNLTFVLSVKDNTSVLIITLCREKGKGESREMKCSSESCMNFAFQNY